MTNTLLFLISIFLITGCNNQTQPRQYTEEVSQSSQAQSTQEEPMGQALTPAPAAASVPASANPHAGIDMGANVTPDAKAQLQQMLAQGQDPHAGMDMSAFAGMMPSAPAGPSPLTWEMPEGWKQGPSKVMRLVSFYKDGDPDAIDCYIVALPGMAGGQEANLKRWMGQINIDTSDANYQKLLSGAQSIQTKGGFDAKFYDLDSLQSSPSDKSMIAAIISTNDNTIFVKMTGSSNNLKANQAAFLKLLKSLSPNNA